MEVDIQEAESQLSELIERVLDGEDVTITMGGRPVVRLEPIERKRPELGSARGTFVLPDGWDAPLSDGEMIELLRSPSLDFDPEPPRYLPRAADF